MYRMRDIILVVLLCVVIYAVAAGIIWVAHANAQTVPAPRTERNEWGQRADIPRDELCVGTVLQWTRGCKDAVLRHRNDEPTKR